MCFACHQLVNLLVNGWLLQDTSDIEEASVFHCIPCLEDSTVSCLTYGFVRSAEHILPIKQKDLGTTGNAMGDRTVFKYLSKKNYKKADAVLLDLNEKITVIGP